MITEYNLISYYMPLLGHKFYYGNSYTRFCVIVMSICTENGFCFLAGHNSIILSPHYSVLRSPQFSHQTKYVNNVICRLKLNVVSSDSHCDIVYSIVMS